jgi:hypothetical protein
VPQRHQGNRDNERQEDEGDDAHHRFDLGAQDLSGADRRGRDQFRCVLA